MSKYRMGDDTIVDTKQCQHCWEEATDWNGNNHISRATGSQWDHQTLYQSRTGRYYLEHSSQRQGSMPHAEWLSPQDAARWLLHNDHELPQGLEHFAEEVSE